MVFGILLLEFSLYNIFLQFSRAEYAEIVKKVNIDESELTTHKEKINRHLRFAESLRDNSTKSDLIIM